KRLADDMSITESAAWWAVTSWAAALRIAVPNDAGNQGAAAGTSYGAAGINERERDKRRTFRLYEEFSKDSTDPVGLLKAIRYIDKFIKNLGLDDAAKGALANLVSQVGKFLQ